MKKKLINSAALPILVVVGAGMLGIVGCQEEEQPQTLSTAFAQNQVQEPYFKHSFYDRFSIENIDEELANKKLVWVRTFKDGLGNPITQGDDIGYWTLPGKGESATLDIPSKVLKRVPYSGSSVMKKVHLYLADDFENDPNTDRVITSNMQNVTFNCSTDYTKSQYHGLSSYMESANSKVGSDEQFNHIKNYQGNRIDTNIHQLDYKKIQINYGSNGHVLGKIVRTSCQDFTEINGDGKFDFKSGSVDFESRLDLVDSSRDINLIILFPNTKSPGIWMSIPDQQWGKLYDIIDVVELP